MIARPTRKLTITTGGVNIADLTKMPPAARILYYPTGGNNVSLGPPGSDYNSGYPISAGKPDFKDLDQSMQRYAYADSGTVVLDVMDMEG